MASDKTSTKFSRWSALMERLPMTIIYHEGHRRLQDQFDSRRIADRLDQVTARATFTDDDRTFIEGRIFFFVPPRPLQDIRPAISKAGHVALCASSHRTS
jgi:hypothetical protein